MKKQQFWAVRPSTMPAGSVGYFGRASSMPRGQRLAVLAEACGGFFKVAPVNRRSQICGRVRSVKRSNLALVQSELFVAG